MDDVLQNALTALRSWGVDPYAIAEEVGGEALWAGLLLLLSVLAWLAKNVLNRIRSSKATARRRGLFSIVAPRLTRTSYMPIKPPIDLLDPQQQQASISLLTTPFFIAPPDDVEDATRRALKRTYGLLEGDPGFPDSAAALSRRLEKGEFASADAFDLEKGRSDAFAQLGLEPVFPDTKRDVLLDYLCSENGFHFNGPKFGVDNITVGRDQEERPTLEIRLQPTDYYTHSVITASSASILDQPEMRIRARPGPYLSEYFATGVQRYIHPSLGVCIVLHTLEDDRLIITRRSAHSANRAGEAGKYFHSACEGINYNDVDPNIRSQLNGLPAIALRALEEEVFGRRQRLFNVSDYMETCLLTGVLLYLPHLSINLSLYVALRCRSSEVRERYVYARDAGFETSEIIFDKRFDKDTGLPEGSVSGIRQLVAQTLTPGVEPSEIWDEGALISFMLASLAVH